MSAFDNIKAAFRRKPRELDTEDMTDVDDLNVNDTQRKKQNLILGGMGGAALLLGSYYIFSGDEKADAVKSDGSSEYKVATGDLVNRNMSEKEWMARSEARFQSMENQLKAANGVAPQVDQLQAQLATAQSDKASMASEGSRTLSAYQQENEQLRAALAASKSAPVMGGPAAMYGNRAPTTYTTTTPGGTTAGNAALAAVSGEGFARDVKLVSFEGGPSGTATRISGGSTAYTDSPNYLPPNSIARAKVIVGVDASAGVSSQSDPLPVVLRVTGPARSVYRQGKLLTTAIQGCLVNGAARGDLSSEKVYVKLQRMTCPQSNGRYAVSDVKGFIAFAGKTGVRGRVVSREGSLVTQGFLAGLAGGFGRGFSANANALFQGTNISTNGKRQQLSTGDILQGGFGEGVAQSADQVSKYLIERAEQYQPVIEMPTGIDVEIVFLEGVFIQN